MIPAFVFQTITEHSVPVTVPGSEKMNYPNGCLIFMEGERERIYK